MLNFEKLKRRGILTETLPYEVPTLFSNEFLFASELSSGALDEKLANILTGSDYRRPLKTEQYTIPLNYQIRKGAAARNTLSIIHPLQQISISDFLDDYANTIIEECKNSPLALRAPAEIVPFLSKSETERFFGNEDDFESRSPSEGLSGVDYAASFFSLKKYNLLNNFYGSNEILRLETRFSLLKTIDVTKCFFNLYTHSITWAVKNKAFSKQHTQKYSFESRFDDLMQKANYNETNGIPVGPEISRNFAEIIFQKIDENVISKMETEFSKVLDQDYSIRRYVDDFFLFANDRETLDRLTRTIEDALEEYKLFKNTEKEQLIHRPFVTSISLAKKGINEAITKLHLIAEEELAANPETILEATTARKAEKSLKDRSRRYREILEELRVVIGQTKTNFNEVSSSIYRELSEAVSALSKNTSDDSIAYSGDISIRLRGMIRILFYCVSSDFRVPPLFKCDQIIRDMLKVCVKIDDTSREVIKDLIVFELAQLFEVNVKDEHVNKIPIELCNLLIIAAQVDAELFLQQVAVKDFLAKVPDKKEFSYFAFISLIFLLRRSQVCEPWKNHVIKYTKRLILKRKVDLRKDAEIYLLFSDFISCPYIPIDERKKLINAILTGSWGQLNGEEVRELAPHFAFVDWSGRKISYLLLRKRLQPVYFA